MPGRMPPVRTVEKEWAGRGGPMPGTITNARANASSADGGEGVGGKRRTDAWYNHQCQGECLQCGRWRRSGREEEDRCLVQSPMPGRMPPVRTVEKEWAGRGGPMP